MGGPSEAGPGLHLVCVRGVVKNHMNRKLSLVILRQALFNSNSDETILAEYQIEFYGVKEYSCPRISGRKQLVEARFQVGCPIKIGISWDGSTIYLDVTPPY